MNNFQKHPFHLVDASPWPIFGAMACLVTTTGAVMYFHGYQAGDSMLYSGILLIIWTMWVWWRDIIREATYQGHHTKSVQQGIRYGVILFIVSEVMFFVAFFWAYFHSSLSPSIEFGAVWPPVGIEAINPWEVPLLNTVILLSSGATITWSHHAIIAGNRKEAILGLVLTIVLALIFTALQGYEYYESSFTISDGVYGSTFFIATGFHGLHVIVGTIFLTVSLVRLIKYHFSRQHHIGFEASAWYFHFVDVVWLFLFVSIYWWGS